MKVFSKILRVIGTLTLIVMIIACVPVVVPKAMGLEVYAVISGSMEPTLPTDSLVFVKRCGVADIEAGDIIAFDSQIAGGGTITHRVVRIDQEERSIITKGDANASIDVTPVRFDHLIGNVKAYFPWLGKVALFLSDNEGKLIAGVIILFAILCNLLATILEKAFYSRKQKEKQLADSDNQSTKKTKGKGSVILLLAVGLILISVAGFNLFRIFSDYNSSNELYDTLEEEYVASAAKTQEVPWYELVSVDLTQLKEKNSDVIGWIYFENEQISYPILYSGDDDYYLRRTMDKKSATAGSIFMEGLNHPDFEDSHTIIYGHNMRNLSMFGRLKYYKQDPEYYIDHSYFQIIKEGVVYRYKIFAFSDVNPDSFIYSVPYAPGEEFDSFINRLYQASYRQTGVTATSEDKIITLSTCSTGEMRFVLHAIRVDEHTYE